MILVEVRKIAPRWIMFVLLLLDPEEVGRGGSILIGGLKKSKQQRRKRGECGLKNSHGKKKPGPSKEKFQTL